jgi:eukaryotic-like serine/threonine-protein kinase
METDRALLFGVLALQADLIDSDQFVQVCTAWIAHKDKHIADLLIERGWILPADKAHLDYLLERKLKKHAGDVGASLAGVADGVKRSLAALGDSQIQESLAGLPCPDEPILATTIDSAAMPSEHYTLTRLHATGGIGRVWLAHDSALGRNVALKELRPERAEQQGLCTRFLREARITGQLEHPGIVPVYELGRRPTDQQPFYTMRFVKGRTLTKAAQDFHQQRGTGGANSLTFVTLLNAFVTVCNTVAYAHSRGVIHRDLKGQNVVLGDFGEVVVLDWGLAKLIGTAEGESTGASVVLDNDLFGESDLSVQGQAIGTPAYMAPEQAAGRVDAIDQRTDIYGLGALLYEVLTGKPPFAGSDAKEVLRKVQENVPIPPRQIWAEVPPALEAICLRALAKKPGDRFASATEPARQVQQWQDAERQKAEEALRQQTNLLQSVLDSIGDGVVVTDESKKYTLWNPAAERILGVHFAEPPSRDLILGYCFLPDKVTRFPIDEYPVERVARGQEVNDTEVFFCHPKKPEGVLISMNARLLRGADGRVRGGVGVFRDVTERKRTEEALKDSEALYHDLVENLPLNVLRKDREGRFTFANKRLCATVGKPLEQLLGRKDADLFPLEFAEKYRTDDLRVIESGKSFETVEQHQSLSGKSMFVQTLKTPVHDAKGRIVGVQAIFWDITERKEAEEALRDSEERYRSVIAAMQDGIVLRDAAGAFLACNASAERILGLSAQEMKGRTPLNPGWRAIHEDGSPFPSESFPTARTLRTGKPCFDVVMGVEKPNGEPTWIWINSQPLFRPGELAPYAVVASFEDITDRKRTEELLKRTAEELERVKRDRGV